MACLNAAIFDPALSLEALTRTVRALGYDTLELSRPHHLDRLTTPATRRAYRAHCAAHGLRLRGLDCWVEVRPYDRWGETLAGFDAAIAWAAEMDCGFLISHDPWLADTGGRSPSRCLRTCIDLFRQVA